VEAGGVTRIGFSRSSEVGVPLLYSRGSVGRVAAH
jgi:hypothetical protein